MAFECTGGASARFIGHTGSVVEKGFLDSIDSRDSYRGSATGGRGPDPETARVPPDQYRENLKKLIELSGEAEIILLAFPQTTSLVPWVEVQRELGTSLFPRCRAMHSLSPIPYT